MSRVNKIEAKFLKLKDWVTYVYLAALSPSPNLLPEIAIHCNLIFLYCLSSNSGTNHRNAGDPQLMVLKITRAAEQSIRCYMLCYAQLPISFRASHYLMRFEPN